MKELDLNKNIYLLTSEHPELITILREFGFVEITKPGMLYTVGRFMKLKQGCSLRKIDYHEVVAKLKTQGYIIKEENNE